MRILYGVTGEGLGHTMRSSVLIAHLTAQGHEVKVVASGRAVEHLRHDDVQRIAGLSMVYRDGGLERLRTARRFVVNARAAAVENAHVAAELLSTFRPDVVLSDFDSFSYLVGRALRCPIVSVDHQHVLSRFVHPRAVRQRLSYDFRLVRTVVERKMPRCDRYIVSSFYFPDVRPGLAATTSLVGPIVRPEVDALSPTPGEHVLVYQTGSGNPRLLAALHRIRELRFVVYGNATSECSSPHVEHRAFSEAGFLADLASARAVVANGGYTTLSEAVCLGKPVLSVPIRHQGEQELNAAWLAHEARGVSLRGRVTEQGVRRALGTLLAMPPRPRAPSATSAALREVDRVLAEVA